MKKILFVLLILLVSALPLAAMEIGGKQMPDSATEAGQQLILNGAGLRSKLFFKIYAGGLYLPESSRDPAAIINADTTMMVRMHFIYDGVSAKKLQNGWKEGFALTAPAAGEALQREMTAFINLFDREAKEDDVYDIIWQQGKGMEVRLNGKVIGSIAGLDLKKALFAIWLGDKPVDKDLKKGMVGK